MLALYRAGPAGPGVVPAPMATGNLREPLSSFVGRTAELQELTEAVRSSPLVTLVGPGGVGKTRLAVEAAATLREEHRDGPGWSSSRASPGPRGCAGGGRRARGGRGRPSRGRLHRTRR